MANLQLRAAAELELRRRRANNYTVVGFVDPEKGLTHSLSNQTGTWVESKDDPNCYLPAKLEPVLKSDKRFIVVYGGRDSGKSVGISDFCLIDAKDKGAKTYCLREFQSSIKNSVHSLLKSEYQRLEFDGFSHQATSILRGGEDAFQFAGISRNIDSIKSAHGFRRFWVEEAQFLSQNSLDVLTPTARNKPNKGLPGNVSEINKQQKAQIIFVANPESSEDPFSKRFLVPFQKELDADGFYEDDLHLIVKMNYSDNPWKDESGTEEDRVWAKEHLARALYDHIWLGAYNDSVENSLILAEWFDACVDAHIKLGFPAQGARIAAHDPSDIGPDNKGYALRHGNVFLDVDEMDTGTVNDGARWACTKAIQANVDYFSWDADGMGCAIGEQVSQAFSGKHTRLVAFKGSESPDNPEAIYRPAQGVSGQIKIKDALKNKRAQYYSELRDRCYRTYLAVEKGEYHDPDTLISFSSKIALLSKLRSELCRMPIKHNNAGKIELYTKDEMKTKFKFPSPNLADSVMISMRFIRPANTIDVMPRPIRSMGIR